ncbi:hypothetical protein BC831DRAFT_453774 [Entophlyctis helioformis]|nr:hypothetical protein BC831DRAFT_453774 [Entophlyctis helioformis]
MSTYRRPRTYTTTGAPGHIAPANNTLRSLANNGFGFEDSQTEEEGGGQLGRRNSGGEGGGGGLRRFQALEDLITSRPDKETLIERNILKTDKVSGVIAATQEKLKKQLIEDTLKSQIESRPQAEALKESHILQEPGI